MGIFSFLKKSKPQEQPPIRSEQKQQESIKIPAVIDGQKIAYQYEKVGIVLSNGVDLDSIFGQRLQFDASCSPVALGVNNQLIGTVGNTKLSDMIADWLRRGEPVFAVVTRIDDERKTAAFDLYLYRDELKYLLRRYPDAKSYKLTGNRRGEMQDNLCHCSRGDECTIEYDIDKEKYLVSAVLDIGYLPTAAAKIAEEQGENNLSVYVADIDSEDGVDSVFVYIFPKGNARK